MRNIKGPRSALTDFIEEKKIKIKVSKSSPAAVKPTSTVPKPKRRHKAPSYAKPTETVNFETSEKMEIEREVNEMLENLENMAPDDSKLRKLSIFLSARRKMNKFYFDYLVKNVTEQLVVFDCSMIRDCEFAIPKRLKSLELFQCGQIKPQTLNIILGSMNALQVLKITGAFLLDSFVLPPSVRILDVTNCSRLNDEFISSINESFTSLDELRLSYCYGISKNARLTTNVSRLYICETKISSDFIKYPENLRHLSIKRCPNINILPDLVDIQYLDVEGIVPLTLLPDLTSAEYLNISFCSRISKFASSALKSLNVSHMHLTHAQLAQIYECKSLQILDISWNPIVDDNVLNELIEKLNLKTLRVFGCFMLSIKSVEFSYNIRERCLVIGNPAETHYLLNGS